jgi:hypothetical protein
MVHRLGELSARLDQINPFLDTDGRETSGQIPPSIVVRKLAAHAGIGHRTN